MAQVKASPQGNSSPAGGKEELSQSQLLADKRAAMREQLRANDSEDFHNAEDKYAKASNIAN